MPSWALCAGEECLSGRSQEGVGGFAFEPSELAEKNLQGML